MTVTRLADVAGINPLPERRPSMDEIVSFVPMAELDARTAATSQGTDRPFKEVQKGYTIFSDGDILVAKITPCFQNNKIGRAQLRHPVGVGSTEFHIIRPLKDRLDARYALHFLRQSRILLDGERRMTGSGGQRRVPAEFLAALEVPLPPVKEQRRVAAILDQADALRAKRREALAHLDDLTQAIFLDMFGDPVRNHFGWPREPLSSLLTSIDSGQSPVCLARAAGPDEWAVLKLGAVTYGRFDANANKALPPGFAPRPELEVKPGDLLFTRKNTADLVGATAIVGVTRPKLLLPDLIFRLNFRDSAEVHKDYLHRLLMWPSKRKTIQGLANGSAGSMPNISKAKLRNVPIELPPMRVQQEFAERVAGLERARLSLQAQVVGFNQLFSALQAQAFEGGL